MYFRTQDKEFMSKVRKAIIEDSNNPQAWRFIYNQLYIDDMNSYLRSISNTPVICGVGNYTPNTMIIAYDGFDNRISSMKFYIRDMNLPIESFWITPIIKSISIKESLSVNYIIREIVLLNPNNIILYDKKSLDVLSVALANLQSNIITDHNDLSILKQL